MTIKGSKRKREKKSLSQQETKKVNNDQLDSLQVLQHQHNLLLEHSLNLTTRTLTLSGDLEEGTFDYFDARVSILENQNKEPITVKLCSNGGSTYEAGAIIGRMKSSPCEFIVEGYGCVMSAATLILASGNKRKLSRYAWFMHHGPRWGTEGNHANIKEAVKQTDREDTEWNKWMGEFSTKDATFWKKWSGHSDLYLSPEEALEYGVIDEII
jgi:ATP-dependent protease ClpP protease subunit